MVGHGARALIQKAVTTAGTTLDDATFDAAFATFLDYYADHVADLTTPFPNVIGTLGILQGAGVKLDAIRSQFSDRIAQAAAPSGLVFRRRRVWRLSRAPS